MDSVIVRTVSHIKGTFQSLPKLNNMVFICNSTAERDFSNGNWDLIVKLFFLMYQLSSCFAHKMGYLLLGSLLGGRLRLRGDQNCFVNET